MDTLQTKLSFLLQKYEAPHRAELNADASAVTVEGKTYPLLPYRNERRFIELKKIVDTTVGEISHFKIMALHPESMTPERLLRQELGIAEFVSGQRITEIFAMRGERDWTVSCRTEKNAAVTLELSCNLPEGSRVVDKHEIITTRGTACDRGVDSQTPLSSVYVYGEKNAEYTDVDFELYGLSVPEIAAVRQSFELAVCPEKGDVLAAEDAHLLALVEAAKKSAETCENVIL